MYRAILFDLDGVLTTDRTGSESTAKSLSRHTGLPVETLLTAYRRHNREMLCGQLTHRDIWPEMCAEIGREIPFALLHTAFIETPMDGAMLDLARDMKAAGCLIGLVTDNKVDRIDAILEHHGLRGLFDAVTISAQVGSGERERASFEDVLAKLRAVAGPIVPQECIFIDNTAHNLVVPAEMGFATYLFDDDKRDGEALRAVLQEHVMSLCGMRCDLCRLYRPNVARRDERAVLCAVFRKVWPGFEPDPAAVICDGCCASGADVTLFSPDCTARRCVQARQLPHCGHCPDYPCPDFPAEPTQAELVQAIDVERRWTWAEERLMTAYRCRANIAAWKGDE